LLAAFLAADQRHPIHNRAGANLESGLLTALVADVGVLGGRRGDGGLFEVDEAALPAVARSVEPRAILLTNLFRDQLDRYGEVDHVATVWREAVADLATSTTLILNADDPALAALGRNSRLNAVYYGVDAPGDHSQLGHIAD